MFDTKWAIAVSHHAPQWTLSAAGCMEGLALAAEWIVIVCRNRRRSIHRNSATVWVCIGVIVLKCLSKLPKLFGKIISYAAKSKSPFCGYLCLPLFFGLSAPAEDLSSFQLLMSFPLFVSFVSRTSLIPSVSLSLFLSDGSLSIFPVLPWVARSRFPFHFCHRHSPSHSEYTWLNIGPQMIIKPSNPQACKTWAGAHRRLLPPVCCLFPRFPSCLETLVAAQTHAVFVFIPKSCIPPPLLPDVLVDFKNATEKQKRRGRDWRDKGNRQEDGHKKWKSKYLCTSEIVIQSLIYPALKYLK